MKNLMLFLIVVLSTLTLDAQKVIENTYDLPSTKKVSLNLKFGKKITVNTWNKNQLGLKTTIKTSDPKLEKMHRMKVEEGSEVLSILTDHGKDVVHNYKNKSIWCCDCDTEKLKKEGYKVVCFEISYEILLPASANLTLKTINGDIEIKGMKLT